MEEKKLVITGMGAVTPLGIGVDAYWQNLIGGRCGIGPITRFDARDLPVRIAGEIRDFDSGDHIPRALSRNMALFSQFAFTAASEALTDAGLAKGADPERTGVVVGSAMDGMAFVAETQDRISTGTMHKVGPRFVPMVLGNMAAGLIAIEYGFRGPSMTLNTACSSGGDAVMTAAMIMKSGEADVMVCTGGESIISPIFIASLAQAKALSRRNDDPEHACRPFDIGHDGFVIGEGGGAIILETEEHAKARGAEIYAELAGYANTQDAYHVTAPDPDGIGAAQCMRLALKRAGLSPSDIGYINAHGTATRLGDTAEASAIQEIFGTGDGSPAVSSTKGATGHMMGAGGLTELIACIKALQTGILPPNLNFETPEPGCSMDIVGNTAREASIHAAMSNSLGFGGQNSSLVVVRDSTHRR